MNVSRERESNVQWRYLELYREKMPSIEACVELIVRTKGVLGLPAAPEQFIASPRGDDGTLKYIMRTSSGTLIDSISRVTSECEYNAQFRQQVALIISSPHTELQKILSECQNENTDYIIKLSDSLIKVAQLYAGRYTRSDVSRLTGKHYRTLFDELLCDRLIEDRMSALRLRIIKALEKTGELPGFLAELCYLIHRLCVVKLHVVGDVFDAGAASDRVLEALVTHHSVDIQWGNHDVLWLGAASGSFVCICNIIRIALETGTAGDVETSYGISLSGLADLARVVYAKTSSNHFTYSGKIADSHKQLLDTMYKAILIIQIKLEGQIIKRRPYFKLERFLAFEKETGIKDIINSFPTVKSDDPYSLSHSETSVLINLRTAFMNSLRLRRHISFLWKNGSLYATRSGNLLIHARIPTNVDGELMHLSFLPNEALGHYIKYISAIGNGVVKNSIRIEYDALERFCRNAYHIGHEPGTILSIQELNIVASPLGTLENIVEENTVLERADEFRNSTLRDRLLHTALAAKITNSPLTSDEAKVFADTHWRLLGQDLLWYLWCGSLSPLVSRTVLPTYYKLLKTDMYMKEESNLQEISPHNISEVQTKKILEEFGVPNGYIITGSGLKGEKVVNIGCIDNHFISLLTDHKMMTIADCETQNGCSDVPSAKLKVFKKFDKERTREEVDDGSDTKEEYIAAKALLDAYRYGFPTKDQDDW